MKTSKILNYRGQWAFCGALALVGTLGIWNGSAQAQPREKPLGKLETVARFRGAMPTGVTVAPNGRIFVNFPRWGDDVPFTVAEIRGGRAVPFPSIEANSFASNGTRAIVSQEKSDRAMRERMSTFVGVQSVVADGRNRLWILDTGSIAFGPTAPGGPKLVCVDLTTDEIEKTIYSFGVEYPAACCGIVC